MEFFETNQRNKDEKFEWVMMACTFGGLLSLASLANRSD